MEPWTYIMSFWLTTWLMLMWRTYSVSMRLIANDQRGKVIIKYRVLHFIVYSIGLIVITPFMWQVCFFEESRKNWVLAYVEGILGRQK